MHAYAGVCFFMTEYLDIVDENNNVIGKDTRENVHANHCIHRGIHVFVVNDKGEILVQQRSMKKDDRPGVYDSSVGAQVLSGETYEQAAIRETKEELGFKPSKLEKIRDYKSFSKRQREIRRFFVCHYNGPFSVDKEEVESIEFWSPKKISKEIEKGEKQFTDGFKISFQKYLEFKK